MPSKRALERAITLSAVTGLKVSLGPAIFATARKRPEAHLWVMAALGEMVLDKLGFLPSRSRMALLVPRAAVGAWVAHESLKEDGVDDPGTAMMGAAVAAGVALAAPAVRMTVGKVFRIPDAVLGLVEDGLAVKLAADACDLSLNDLGHSAQEAVSEVGDRIAPMVEGRLRSLKG